MSIEEKILERLPGDLRRVAELIGIENAMLLVEHFGGSYLIIPKCKEIIRDIRDRNIRALYDTNEYTIRELAMKFQLTDRRISDILSETGEDVPRPLLDLMQDKF